VALTVRNLAAFGCADRAELKKWALRLDELGTSTVRSRMRTTARP
jgi:hypothetical protein